VAAPPAGTVNRSRWLSIAGLGLALLMVTLDMTIVAVALPVIGRDLQASPQQAQRVMLASFLPAVALAIPAGRWIDDAGPGRRSRSRSSGSGRRASSCNPQPPQTHRAALVRMDERARHAGTPAGPPPHPAAPV
jgi:hypothetical protein